MTIYYLPGTVLGAVDTAVKKTSPVKLTSQWGEKKINLKISVYCHLIINDIKKKQSG